MKKEDEPRPLPLTLETLTQGAKETLLKRGTHPPTQIAQGSRDSAIVEFELFHRGYEARAQQMFGAGVLLAQARHIGRLHEVFFITEGWMSFGGEDRLSDTLPSQDPQRIEVLTVSCYMVLSRETKLVVFEIMRDKTRRLTKLKELPLLDALTQADSPLMDAFVLGFDVGSDSR
jgi:hypothetical protein